jgi:glucosamine--fructose-6-phosphate aminotransferase (isomerizing)
LAQHVFLVRAGKERSVAATKTYTGQMLLLYLLAYSLGAPIRLAALERVPEMASAALTLEPAIAEMSERYRFLRRAVVVGRGLNYPNAMEFALKLMETCYVVVNGLSSADFLHGPIALVEPNFPVFVFAPPGSTWDSMRITLEKLRELRAEVVGISDPGNREVEPYLTRVIRLPKRVPERFSPIPYIVPAQLFSASLAAQKGLDPDQPRTISKVTQTL